MSATSQPGPDAQQGSDSQVAAALDAATVVLRAQAAALSHQHLADSATAFAAELAESFSCVRVSVGLLAPGGTEGLAIVATSQGTELQAHRDAASAIAAAMHEALDQAATISVPPPAGGLSTITLAHQLLAQQWGTGSAPGAACSVPMKGVGGVIGAVTLERAGRAFTVEELALCEDIASFTGPVFGLQQEAEQPWRRRAVRHARTQWHEQGSLRTKGAVGAAVMLLLAATLMPVGYRVSAPARLEGSIQRAITAPADGFLQQANVRAGDTVREGQVLAEMAAQDLQLERRRRESELRQHESAYQTAQSRNDRAQMVVSQSRAAEAQAMLSLIDGQIERARIVAPFDGIVIKGDLSQNLGAPVQRGEVLLTLAPNDSFRLIVEVEEGDIGAIAPGQHGQLALAAMPDKVMGLTVRRIVPVATSADARNYFEVEAALDAPVSALRPGLRGVAKIEAGERSALWLLTHRALDWLRITLWSAGL